MANELVKEKIILDRNVGSELTQILLEGDIIVPYIKPDMAVILQADAKLVLDKTEILTDRVNFMGKLYIQVLYLAKGEERLVHSIGITAAVDDFIHMEGVTNDMWVEVKPDIQNIDFRMINDRKISYKAVAEVQVKTEGSEVFEIVVNIDGLPENQQLKNNLILNKSVANKHERFVVKDEVSVPQGKPNIREILQTTIEVGNQDVRVQNGRINVFGELLVTTLYKGEDEGSIIEFMEHELPFNGNIEMSECKEDMFADVSFFLADQNIQIKPDDGGEDRRLEIEASLALTCRVNAAANIEVLEDAHVINKKLGISRNIVKYPKLVCRNKNQSTVKEVVQLDDTCPDILQIFRVKGKVITDEVKIINDKVIVEGAIETDILYIAESDEMPLYSHKAMVAFRQIVETKGAMADMSVNLDAMVDHVGFNMLSGREVEVRFLISFKANVCKTMEAAMITHINFDEFPPDLMEAMPSIIMYVVGPGDSLWKIAKEYNTGIDEIAEINELENPNEIYPGQKILILKKVVVE